MSGNPWMLSPVDFDGITDLSPLIQNALDTYGQCDLPPLPDPSVPGLLNTAIVLSDGQVLQGNSSTALMPKDGFGTGSVIRNANWAPASESEMDRVFILGLRLLGNRANQSGNIGAGDNTLIELRGIRDSIIEVDAEEAFSDVLYITCSTADASVAPLRTRYRVNGRGVGRNVVTEICSTGTYGEVFAQGFGLHGLDIEPNNDDELTRGGYRYVCGRDGGGDFAPSIPSYLCSLAGGDATLDDLEVDVCADGGIVGGALAYRSCRRLRATVSASGCSATVITGIPGGTHISTGIITGTLNIPESGRSGFVDRGAGSQVGTRDLQIVTAANYDAFNIQLGGPSQHYGLKVIYDGAGNPQYGIRLSGCTAIQLAQPYVEGARYSFQMGTQSSTASAYCNIIGGISTGALNKAFEEESTCNHNYVNDLLVLSGGSVTKAGANTLVSLAPLVASATWDPASVGAGASVTTTVTVTGVVSAGSYDIQISFAIAGGLGGLVLSGYVSANDTVTAVLANPTAAAVNLGSGTLVVVARRLY